MKMSIYVSCIKHLYPYTNVLASCIRSAKGQRTIKYVVFFEILILVITL
jgi:hypothetical protein